MQRSSKGLLIKGLNQKDIYTYIWDRVQTPRGVVQIFHGMAEHAKRYDDFAAYLNKTGFIVYANDHRGHGKTADSIKSLGYIGEDGFNVIVEDEYCISQLIKTKYPKLPLIIFGHSFGSFIAQEYLIRYSPEVQGIILSGSSFQKGLQIQLGAFITLLQHYLTDEKKPNYFMDFLSFASFGKKFTDSASKFRWLSSDKLQVEKYENDPYCGTVFPTNFYYYLFKGFKTLYDTNRLTQIKKDIPILIISGASDPVGGYSKSITKLYKLYTHLKINDVTLKLFPNGRHEMLNEVNKSVVYAYLSNWIENCLKK